MGRGNVCTFGKCEGLYYIDNDDLCVYRPIGGDADDLKLRRSIPFEDLCLWEYSDVDTEWWEEDVLEEFKSSIRKKFPSFVPCDKWVEREKHAILQNQLFYIALEDNEWSLAVELLQRDEGWGDDWRQNLQKRHFQRYLDGIRDSLFEQFESLGIRTGAWTSGTIHRPQEGGESE